MAIPERILDDRQLAVAFKGGDLSAYDDIYARYCSRVSSLCRRMLVNQEDAREATQETFLRVYQALGRFNGRYQLGAWITRIATNVCLDHLRASTRRRTEPVADELLQLDLTVPIDEGPEHLTIRNAEGRRVRKVLAGLPPLHRAAIVLRDFEGLSYEEVAVALGVTDIQVKALLHRARRGFRRSWSAQLASLLVPIRSLVQRARELAPVTGEQAGGLVTSSQCAVGIGAERLCAAAAAVILTGGLSAGLTGHQPQASASEPAATTLEAGEPVPEVLELVSQVRPDRRRGDRVSVRHDRTEKVVPAGEAPPSEPLPVPPPEPAPTPTPEPSPSAEPQPEPPPSPTPEPSPTLRPADPAGFDLAFGTDVVASRPCECLADTQVSSEEVWISDYGLTSFEQTVTGTAHAAGSPSHGLWLRHWSGDGIAHRADVGLRTAEGTFYYRAEGTVVERTRTEWGGWLYRYEGSYELASRPGGSDAMPERGSYVAEVVLSWRESRIVSVTYSMTESS